MMKSSTRWPTSLSTKAVQTAVFRPKAFRRPREVLYSPPPSQALKRRAVRMRPSPGSRRSMTSPSESWSRAHWEWGRRVRLMAIKGGAGRCSDDDAPVEVSDQLWRARLGGELVEGHELGLREEEAAGVRGPRCPLGLQLA